MIEKGAIKKSTAQAICDAVKVKEGTTEGVPFKDVAKRILALPMASGENRLAKVIERTVTELTEAYFEGVTQIGKSAFDSCDKLITVNIPDNITSIGEAGFRSCTNLINATIGNTVSDIGKFSFISCSRLTDITLGSAVANIGERSFDNCLKLTNVYYNRDITSWCRIYFGGIRANPMTYAHKVYMKNSANEYEIITNLIIPDTITDIRQYAFVSCHSFVSATIHNGVTEIGNSAFSEDQNLLNMTIGSGVIKIGAYALEIGNATNKATIRFLGTTPPSIQSNSIGKNVEKIIVPVGCGDIYKSATNFSAKADIIEEETE